MNINDLVNTLQALNNNKDNSNNQISTISTNHEQNNNSINNNINYNDNYFKSQYPSPLTIQNNEVKVKNINENANHFQTSNNISGTINQPIIATNDNNKCFNSKPNQNSTNPITQNSNNFLSNLLGLNGDNQNLITLLQTILPLLTNTTTNNPLKSLFNSLSGNKKNTTTQGCDDENECDIDISHLIKIDDT